MLKERFMLDDEVVNDRMVMSKFYAPPQESKVANMESKCPRCNGDSIELGEIQLPIGSTKNTSVDLNFCGKCSLVFGKIRNEVLVL